MIVIFEQFNNFFYLSKTAALHLRAEFLTAIHALVRLKTTWEAIVVTRSSLNYCQDTLGAHTIQHHMTLEVLVMKKSKQMGKTT